MAHLEGSYKRGIGPAGLMLSAVSAMLGSGLLFSCLYVARLSGPASIIAWVLGAILVMFVALTYAELSSMLPITGGSTRFPQLTHGTFVSLVFGWITWFGLMTAPPIETQAMLQYAAIYWKALMTTHSVTLHGTCTTTSCLTTTGYVTAAALMLLFSVINLYSIQLITRVNNLLTAIKIIAPLTIVWVFFKHLHVGNFHNPSLGGFSPYGWHGIFAALASGGILFAFNGYKQAVELAGEAKKPKRTILIAIIGAIVLSLIVYLLIQIGFVGVLSHDALKNGWQNLHFTGEAGPLFGLLATLGSAWAVMLLFADTYIATGAAGLVFTTSAARNLYGLSANRQLPFFIRHVNPRGIPANAVIVNFLAGMAFLMMFHSWFNMAKFLSAVIALSYLTGPLCCLSLRFQLPDYERPFKIPFPKLWCFFSFYVCTLIVYWTGWMVVSKLGLALLCSLVLYVIYRLCSERPRSVKMHWDSALWMLPYLGGLSLISYLGSYDGGKNIIHFGYDFIYIALLCAGSLYLAIKLCKDSTHTEKTILRYAKEIRTGRPATIPVEKKRAAKKTAPKT